MDLDAELTAFLAGQTAARGEGQVHGFVIAYLADDGAHFSRHPSQALPVSLGLTSFAEAWVRDDLQREFDKIEEDD